MYGIRLRWNPVKELKVIGILIMGLAAPSWNPVKELKVTKNNATQELITVLWNPVKELKDDVQHHDQPRPRLLVWNPVKELKGTAAISRSPFMMMAVESGEGIKSLPRLHPATEPAFPRGIR